MYHPLITRVEYSLQCYWLASGGVREARKLLCFEQSLNGSVTSQKIDSGRERTNKTTVNEERLMATESSASFLSKNNFPGFLNSQGENRKKKIIPLTLYPDALASS